MSKYKTKFGYIQKEKFKQIDIIDLEKGISRIPNSNSYALQVRKENCKENVLLDKKSFEMCSFCGWTKGEYKEHKIEENIVTVEFSCVKCKRERLKAKFRRKESSKDKLIKKVKNLI